MKCSFALRPMIVGRLWDHEYIDQTKIITRRVLQALRSRMIELEWKTWAIRRQTADPGYVLIQAKNARNRVLGERRLCFSYDRHNDALIPDELSILALLFMLHMIQREHHSTFEAGSGIYHRKIRMSILQPLLQNSREISESFGELFNRTDIDKWIAGQLQA